MKKYSYKQLKKTRWKKSFERAKKHNFVYGGFITFTDDLFNNEGGNTMKFRKKPVVIEAYQTDKPLDIETLEGTMHADPGDWIITGVHGEQYPCKPDIFALTYEPCEEEK